MATQKYLVTAHCNNQTCPITEFQRQRNKMTYMGTDENEHIIQKLICPGCGMHAKITKIASVDDERKVAHA
ncbi:hypothetical protein [uncultured Desulfuromusa sp.]|uniref:hypothetical protein n=1 Tax=uncultured Desulfuromusa sp. TaxID=219183 RepID=UPI002AA812E0|nr:hypothetical protein [uncultured Desulfuromusa sp.]